MNNHKDRIIEFLKENSRLFDGLNLTNARKTLREKGHKIGFHTLKSIMVELTGDEGYECADGSTLYMNTTDNHRELNLSGSPQYYFQNY